MCSGGDSSLLRRLLGVECWGAVLELSGPPAAARLGLTCRSAVRSSHAEEFWRASCGDWREHDEGSGASSSSAFPGWMARYAHLHGPSWLRRVRRLRLTGALAARGLELRSDSQLCARYIHTGETGANGLDGIVDTMHEMAWFFTETTYQQQRDDILSDVMERARRDAMDAFLMGEDPSVDVQAYIDRPANPELSEQAKARALESYAEWLVDPGSATARGVQSEPGSRPPPRTEEDFDSLCEDVPRTLRHRLRDIYRSLQRGDQPTRRPPADPAEDPAARRARLRARATRVRTQLEVTLAPHIDAMRRFSLDRESPSDAQLVFPPSLTRDERAFLHQLAEQLGLVHESVGEGSERALAIRKFFLDPDEWVVLPDPAAA